VQSRPLTTERRKPKRPYLLRAFQDWIVDSGMTPYLLVDASVPGVAVPREHVNEGKIVLNVAPSAVQGMILDDDGMAFDCRFGGRPFPVRLPMAAISAIYAKETGEGMVFQPEDFPPPPDGAPAPDTPPKPPAPGHLKVVK
jgi:stringent starvation protein B